VGMTLFLFLAFVLILKSHKAVIEQIRNPPKLVDSGVYTWGQTSYVPWNPTLLSLLSIH
jgi:hypothetical protein